MRLLDLPPEERADGEGARDGIPTVSGIDVLRTYRFHTHTAQHHFCGNCGIYTFHRKRVTPDYFGINVFCLEGFDPTGIPVRATVGAAMP